MIENTENSKMNNLLYLMLFFIALEGFFFVTQTNKYDNDFRQNQIKLERIQNILKGTPIIAKAYSVYDINDNIIIYSKNGDIKMPLASLVKIMSISLALNNHKDNKEVIISKNAINQVGDFGMYANEKWNIEDLAKFTLISSANDGAYAMLENDVNYLEKINSKAKRLGMKEAVFLNSTGLDFDNNTASAFATAEDVNIMAIYAFRAYPLIFSSTILPEMTLKSKSGFIHNIKNTNTIIDKIPNLIFSKTGYTTLAGGNLTIIFKDKVGHNIAITILGSTYHGRFTDIEKLVNVLELSY